jgi:hypothetical protein
MFRAIQQGRGARLGRSILTMDQAFVSVLFRACESDARTIECHASSAGLRFLIGNPAAVEALQAELLLALPQSWGVTVVSDD